MLDVTTNFPVDWVNAISGKLSNTIVMMVVNRFNALSLWNAHPFPYLVRSSSFPEACPFDDEELEEWRVFWKSLFGMARERGIET